MAADPAAESRVLGRLVIRGVLSRESVQELFDRARLAAESGQPQLLSELLVEAGLLSAEAFALYLRTDGEDVPNLPGHIYLSKLGEGGTASVFAVRRLKDGAELAVKVLKPELAAEASMVKAFLGEAKLLQRLDHPNVIKGFKAGRIDGSYVSIMETVAGRTLQEAIAAGGAFDEDGALLVILAAARALDYLREHGVVHRDIKPGNIMVTDDSTVKVIDLGFAMTADGEGGDGATTIGTAAFLSPEQAQGRVDLDVRSDIYALGASLYQLVLGELPFSGDDEELVQKAVLEGLSATATKGGRISAHMHYFIEKMMAKDREHRYQDPKELIADIERQIQGKKDLDFDGGGEEESQEMLRKRLARLRRRRGRR
ncbi:MAG: serine/threonine protein kinase [Pseudohongiellaceae bacterium]|jgi:serine/threonine protein kinase